MTDETKWVDEAIAALQLNVRKCDAAESASIVERAMATFVRGNPRAWWLTLQIRGTFICSIANRLLSVVPAGTADVWFIPEDGENKLTAYTINVELLPSLLAECTFFEYYIVAQEYAWLVGENDHDEFFICRNPQCQMES